MSVKSRVQKLEEKQGPKEPPKIIVDWSESPPEPGENVTVIEWDETPEGEE